MKRSMVEQIADAVLYEGYILYPYRPSALKNRQQRWNFGGLCPRSYSEAQNGTEAWQSQTECLALGNDRTAINIRLRFLHLTHRQAAQLQRTLTDIGECSDSDFHFLDTLEIENRRFQTWQEADEASIDLPALSLGAKTESSEFNFQLPAARTIEPLHDSKGILAGAFIRSRNKLEGAAHIETEKFEAQGTGKSVAESLFRIRLQIFNLTPLPQAEHVSRDQAMTYSLVSSHAILNVSHGQFISLLDPPPQYAEAASRCQNIGTYPVLVGENGDRSTMLSSPVILYDYPKIAPQSAGDLFDGTEIEEILTLRILALTDEEKSEMRQSDERARRILDRIESDPNHLARLHGIMQNVDRTGEGQS